MTKQPRLSAGGLLWDLDDLDDSDSEDLPPGAAKIFFDGEISMIMIYHLAI